MNILFVCTGNTCRSPMAEELLRDKMPEVNVQSAGVFAGIGERANSHTIEVLKQHDIESNHKSQPVTEKLLHWADLILLMTTEHKQTLILHYPNFQEKYYTLKEYVSNADKKVWDQLKQMYANYEAKRSLFIQENKYQLHNPNLNEIVQEHFKDDIRKIQRLEGSLSNYNVSDPFGGSMEVYQRTFEELNKYIHLLIKKIK